MMTVVMVVEEEEVSILVVNSAGEFKSYGERRP
jgi:hypothetical protein